MKLTLRPYQKQGTDGIRMAFRRHRKVLYVLPTGGGKTVTFTYIAKSASSKGRRVLILVHRIELIRQTSRALDKFDVDHGIINPKFTPDPRQRVQVASIQTFASRLHTMRSDFDLVVVDEAHHAVSPTWRKVIDFCPKAYILGVTATPDRGDGLGLGIEAGGVFEVMVQGPQIYDLINLGYLVRPRVFSFPDVSTDGLKTVRGDYDRKELERRIDKPTVMGSAIQHYREHADGLPAVAFCVSVSHAEHTAAEFRAAGYRAYSVDGSMDDATRSGLIKGLETGEVQVLTSCDLISEGTDIPAIGAAILLRATQSTSLYIQQVGRALRTSEGKSQAIILDHVGNCIRHGLPTIHRDWSLGGERKKGERRKDPEDVGRVIQCEKCYFVYEPEPACPACGHVPKVKKSELRKVEGELKEITEETDYKFRREKFRGDMAGMIRNAVTLEDFQKIGQFFGYKSGWAWHQYRIRKGVKA